MLRASAESKHLNILETSRINRPDRVIVGEVNSCREFAMCLFLSFAMIIYLLVNLILGFVYAWVLNIVAKEDIPVYKGAVILVLTAIASVIASAGIESILPGYSIWISLLVNFGLLICLTNLIAGVSVKHSAIAAAVCSAMMFALLFGLSML